MISNILAAFHCGFEMVKLRHLFQGHMHALPPVQLGLFVCPNQHIIALGFSFVVLNDSREVCKAGPFFCIWFRCFSGRLSFGTSNENISNNLFARYAGVSTSSSVQNLPRTSDKVYYHQRF